MSFHIAPWRSVLGQQDVPPTLHVPIVYDNTPADVPLWEYHLLKVDTREEELPTEAHLNDLGTRGWMLVSILEQRLSEHHAYVHYYFVRQKIA